MTTSRSGSTGPEPFRAGPQPAEVLDRSQPLQFSFNGRSVWGLRGDTIVSALMANGIRSYAQGRRLQTKRGVLTADRFDPSCALQVDDEPNVPAGFRLADSGQRVRSQHVWPSLRFDLKSVNQRASRLLRPDSQLRASTATGFLRPAYRWLAAHGDVGGRVGDGGAEPDVSVGRRHVDVLVVGGGLAGMVAAEAAALAGAHVALVEADRELGGWLRLAGDPSVAEAGARLARLDGVEVRTGAALVDLDRHGQAVVVVDLPGGGEELTVIRARHVVLACGLIERTLTFTGNDLPGVMLATGARRLADLWAVRPGERAVVLTANSHGDAAAADLRRVGVEVTRVLDARQGEAIQRANGSTELAEVVLGDRSAVAADVLVVAAGWTVDAAGVERAGAQVHSGRLGRPTVEGRPGVLGVVGILAGDAPLDDVIAHATVSGRQAAAAARRGPAAGPTRPLTSVVGVGARRAAPPQPPLGAPLDELGPASVSVGVVDFAEDVTAFELVGTDPVGTARLLGGAAAAPALDSRARAELSDLARRLPGVAELAHPLLTGRASPVQHFAAGPRLGSLARLADRPVRRTALFDEHRAAGGRLERVGEWLDVAHYGGPSAERRTVTGGVGLRDTGRAALFDLQGPDAGRLVSRLIGAGDDPAGVSGPHPSESTGGEAGFGPGPVAVVTRPDGAALIVAHLGEHHWQVRVEPADAARVEATLLTLVHIEHRHWQVYVTAVGEALAGLALVGPGAHEAADAILGRPPVEGVVAPLVDQRFGPGHIWSYRTAGRSVVELRVPAGRAARVWRALLAGRSASEENGSLSAAPGRAARRVRPVGFQALEGRARG